MKQNKCSWSSVCLFSFLGFALGVAAGFALVVKPVVEHARNEHKAVIGTQMGTLFYPQEHKFRYEGDSYKSKYVEVNTEYPDQPTSEFTSIFMKNFAHIALNEFMNEVSEDEIKELGTVALPWTREVSFTIYKDTPELVSVLATVYEYTGGAHGNTEFLGYVFPEQGHISLPLKVLLNEGAFENVVSIAKDKLRAEMVERTEGEFDEAWFLLPRCFAV